MIYTHVTHKWVAAVTSPLDGLNVVYRCHVNHRLCPFWQMRNMV
jgi:hypothetical protein